MRRNDGLGKPDRLNPGPLPHPYPLFFKNAARRLGSIDRNQLAAILTALFYRLLRNA
jgi:hypothetical protein